MNGRPRQHFFVTLNEFFLSGSVELPKAFRRTTEKSAGGRVVWSEKEREPLISGLIVFCDFRRGCSFEILTQSEPIATGSGSGVFRTGVFRYARLIFRPFLKSANSVTMAIKVAI